ncbi:MAG: hypothetical protein ABFE07_02615 [Armatimonadia bacterium]
MPYESLLRRDVIRAHGLTVEEISKRIVEMFAVIERHLQDVEATDISVDGRYNNTYGAARVAAEIVMMAEGFRPGRAYGNHAAVFAFLRAFPHEAWQMQARLFDEARKKRNILEYERANIVTQTELDTLRTQVERFLYEMKLWLQADHRELQPT